jgi:hypothetical protein
MDGLGQLEVEGFSEIQQRLPFKRHYLSRAAISHACAWRGHRGEDRDSARAFATEKMCRREFAAHGRVWSPLLVGACAAHLEFLSGVLVRWTPLLQRSEVAHRLFIVENARSPLHGDWEGILRQADSSSNC